MKFYISVNCKNKKEKDYFLDICEELLTKKMLRVIIPESEVK